MDKDAKSTQLGKKSSYVQVFLDDHTLKEVENLMQSEPMTLIKEPEYENSWELIN